MTAVMFREGLKTPCICTHSSWHHYVLSQKFFLFWIEVNWQITLQEQNISFQDKTIIHPTVTSDYNLYHVMRDFLKMFFLFVCFSKYQTAS